MKHGLEGLEYCVGIPGTGMVGLPIATALGLLPSVFVLTFIQGLNESFSVLQATVHVSQPIHLSRSNAIPYFISLILFRPPS